MNRNGWDDKRSKINVEKSPKGVVTKITGKYWHNDVQFNVTLKRQTKGEYIMRGQCSIISPRDGRVLQVQGQERRLRQKRMQNKEPIINLDGQICLKPDNDDIKTESENIKAKKQKELNITEAIYSKTDDLETIKKLISRKVEKMYGVNILAIEDSINRTVTTQNIHSAQAVRIYAAKYIINCCSVSKKVSKSYMSTLIHAGAVLDHCQMGEIKQSDIRALEKSFNNGAKKKIQIVKRFWDYARDLGLYCGSNPFDIYTLKNGNNTRSAEALQRDSVTYKALPINVENKLNQRISENLNDGRILGLILVKGAGLSAKDACKITWGDLIFDSENYQYVRVYIFKNDLAGATHDYTHPIFPFEAELLHTRYDVLVKKYSTDKLKNMFVATATSSEKKQLLPKDLTAFCRTELLQSGIGYAAIAKAKDNESGGGGIRLLIYNYEQKLTYECGLVNDSASVKFLMGRSLLGDVTANNYRSFSCPEGQERLYRIMRRDGRFSTKKDMAEPVKRENTPSGGETITVASPDPQRLSGAKLVIRLKKGETISVISPCGVEGVISARSIKSDGTTRRK